MSALGAAAIGAGISALGSGLSSLFGSSSNYKAVQDTNKTNLAIAQMNNEYNEKLLEKQLEYNTEMWNAENEYNTASAQRERLEDAGLNAQLIMSGDVDGNLAGSYNSINPNYATAPRLEAPQYDYSGLSGAFQQLGSAVGDAVNAAKTSAETKGINLENQYKTANALAQINYMAENTKNVRLKNDYQQLENSLKLSTFDSEVQKAQLFNKSLEVQMKQGMAQSNYIEMMSKMTGKQLQYFDQKTTAEIAKLAADTALLSAQRGYTFQETRNAMVNELKLKSETEQLNWNNYIIRETVDDVLNKTKFESLKSEMDYYDYSSNAWSNYISDRNWLFRQQNNFRRLGESWSPNLGAAARLIPSLLLFK